MGLDHYIHVNSKKVARDAHRVMGDFDRDWYRKRDTAIVWRKANAVHKWLVERVTGREYEEALECGYYGQALEVEPTDLLELRDICKNILEHSEIEEREEMQDVLAGDGKIEKRLVRVREIKDSDLAEELLPTQEGFFFGAYDYGEWYVGDLEHTVEAVDAMMEHVIKDPEGKFDWEWVHEDEPDWTLRFEYAASW